MFDEKSTQSKKLQNTPIFSYSSVGVSETANGHNWLFSRKYCPFCTEQLHDIGAFHSKPIIADYEDSGGFCLGCGMSNTPFDKKQFIEQAGNTKLFIPREDSPLAACLSRVLTCENCGWWCTGERTDVGNSEVRISTVFGILHEFDLTSASTPVEVLNAEISQWIHRLDSAHPNRMEDFIQGCLSGVFDCEVSQIGYTRDGGIDLFVLRGNEDIAVQVRRRRSDKTESVAPIREFLGAALLKNTRNLLYASTAKKFSNEAKATARRAIKLDLVDTYELLDLDGIKMLAPSVKTNVWRYSLESMVQRGDDFIFAPDPYKLGAVDQ